MTQKEKDLLLKDLCGRLPYGVKVVYLATTYSVQYIESKFDEIKLEGLPYTVAIGRVKPYLRPLSSMTKEEREYLEELSNFKATPSVVRDKVDFYLEHHLDYRGLIPMGLALEALEGMY